MALPYHTIQELTDYNYNELSYNGTEDPIKNKYLPEICILLNKCGISVDEKDEYDYDVAMAVSDFQNIAGIESGFGILSNSTLQAIILYAEKMSDNIEDDETIEDSMSVNTKSTLPHYSQFFNENNFKTFRKNRQDIKITFGSGAITKTIKDVFIRSCTVEVDTSGNPISEVYEFVAKDIVESDEIRDYDKYMNDYETGSSSDIQRIYNYDSLKKSDDSTTHSSDKTKWVSISVPDITKDKSESSSSDEETKWVSIPVPDIVKDKYESGDSSEGTGWVSIPSPSAIRSKYAAPDIS